jgi:Flp pilus assembly protein TadD
VERVENLAQAKEQIRRSVKAGDLEMARRQLAKAYANWDAVIGLQAEEGSILEASGELAQAESLYRTLATTFPKHDLPGVRLVRLLARQGRLTEARDIYERSVWTGGARTDIKSTLLDQLAPSPSNEVDEIHAFLERLLRRPSSDEAMSARVIALKSALQRDAETVERLARARREIRSAIDSGNVAVARKQLAAVLDGQQDDVALRTEEGAILEAEGKPAEAEALYQTLATAFPRNPLPSTRLVRLLARQGRSLEARAVYTTSVWPSNVPTAIKAKLLDQIVRTEMAGIDETVSFLEHLLAQASSDEAMIGRVNAQRQCLRRASDDTLAALGSVTEPEGVMALVRDQLLRADRIVEAQPLAETLVERFPDRLEHVRQLTLLLAHSGQAEALVEALSAGLRRWPRNNLLLRRLNLACLPRAELTKLFKIAKAARPTTKMDAKAVMEYAAAALHAGENEAAHEALGQVDRGPAADYLLQPLRCALARWPRGWSPKERFVDDPSRSVQIVKVDDAVTTLVVFTGFIRGLSHLPLPYLDSLLADYRANVIYLRDMPARGYLTGVAGLGTDVPSTVARLRQITTELGVRTVTLGASLGGFAAIRYGARIGAETAMSLAGPTRLHMSRRLRSGVSLLYGSLSEEERNLVTDVTRHPELRVIVHYGADNAADAMEVRRLQGLPNCRVRAVPGVNDHNVALHMIGRGDFERALTDDLGLERRRLERGSHQSVRSPASRRRGKAPTRKPKMSRHNAAATD